METPLYQYSYYTNFTIFCYNYKEAIDSFIWALQHGITNEEINELQGNVDIFSEANKTIFNIFQSVSEIFNILKVLPENSKSDKEPIYLSHTTSFLVGAKLLNHTLENKFRMYHIVYANDPTEGKVLFEKLGVSPNARNQNDEMPYVMVASFCGDKNIKELDTLPMWNMYSENATGIALLFKASDIASKNTGHATSSPLLSYGNKGQYQQSLLFVDGSKTVLDADDKGVKNKLLLYLIITLKQTRKYQNQYCIRFIIQIKIVKKMLQKNQKKSKKQR